MNFSNEMIEKAKTASSMEELLEMAKAEGIELSAADAEEYFRFLHSSGPLSDEELEQVAGGKGDPAPKYYVGQLLWVGYPTSQTYVGIEVLAAEFYTKGSGWRYLVRKESGFNDNLCLETQPYIKTYKPNKWEED